MCPLTAASGCWGGFRRREGGSLCHQARRLPGGRAARQLHSLGCHTGHGVRAERLAALCDGTPGLSRARVSPAQEREGWEQGPQGCPGAVVFSMEQWICRAAQSVHGVCGCVGTTWAGLGWACSACAMSSAAAIFQDGVWVDSWTRPPESWPWGRDVVCGQNSSTLGGPRRDKTGTWSFRQLTEQAHDPHCLAAPWSQ